MPLARTRLLLPGLLFVSLMRGGVSGAESRSWPDHGIMTATTFWEPIGEETP